MDWKHGIGSGNPLLGFPPTLREINSNTAEWKSVSRAEAISWFRKAPVVLLEPFAAGATIRWFNESSPYYSGAGPYRFDGLRYYVYIQTIESVKAPSGPSRSAASEVEWEPIFAEPEPEEFFVELDVKKPDGAPAGGVVYAVELPDGSLRKGRLDSKGQARVQSPVQGQFKISFPEMDASAWEPA
ncbi:MAG: hypothetical protein ABI036_03350 [Fibrobacteria bacterium]